MKKHLKVSLSVVNVLAFALSQYAWAEAPVAPDNNRVKAPQGFSADVIKNREAVVQSVIDGKENTVPVYDIPLPTTQQLVTTKKGCGVTPKPTDPGFVDPIRPKKGCGVTPKPTDPGFVDPVRPLAPTKKGCGITPPSPIDPRPDKKGCGTVTPKPTEPVVIVDPAPAVLEP